MIDPYLPRESIIFAFGPKGTGKSGLIWSWARAIASGESWFGLPTAKGPVMIIEMDQPEQSVAVRVSPPVSEPVDDVTFVFSSPLDIPNIQPEIALKLRELHKQIQPVVVFMNTLRQSTTLKLEDGTTTRLVYGTVRELFPGSSVVFMHHPKKEPPSNVHINPDEMFSGNNAWRNDAQTCIHLQPCRERKRGLGKRRELYSTAILRHTGSQVSPLYKPLHLLLDQDGTNWRCPPFEELSVVKSMLQNYLTSGVSKHSLDKEIGEALKELGAASSPSTARRRREIVERGHFPGSALWLGLSRQEDSQEEEGDDEEA